MTQHFFRNKNVLQMLAFVKIDVSLSDHLNDFSRRFAASSHQGYDSIGNLRKDRAPRPTDRNKTTAFSSVNRYARCFAKCNNNSLYKYVQNIRCRERTPSENREHIHTSAQSSKNAHGTSKKATVTGDIPCAQKIGHEWFRIHFHL